MHDIAIFFRKVHLDPHGCTPHTLSHHGLWPLSSSTPGLNIFLCHHHHHRHRHHHLYWILTERSKQHEEIKIIVSYAHGNHFGLTGVLIVLIYLRCSQD